MSKGSESGVENEYVLDDSILAVEELDEFLCIQKTKIKFRSLCVQGQCVHCLQLTQMRSRSLREARRAGEKMTHSHPNERQRQATKMAMLRTSS
jgi:hypothetical protein